MTVQRFKGCCYTVLTSDQKWGMRYSLEGTIDKTILAEFTNPVSQNQPTINGVRLKIND